MVNDNTIKTVFLYGLNPCKNVLYNLVFLSSSCLLYGTQKKTRSKSVFINLRCLKWTQFLLLQIDTLTIYFSKYTSSNPENVGVVKGIQQQIKTVHLEVREPFLSNSPHSSPKKSSYCGSDLSDRVLESPSHRVAPPYKDPPAPPPYRDPPPPSSNVNNEKFKKNIFQVLILRSFLV